MTQTLAMVGKIGPAFGDGRASFVEVEFSTYHDYDGQTYTERVANWADGDRAEALAGVMERAHDTADRDGDFGGVEYVGGRWPAAEPIYNVYTLWEGCVLEEESADTSEEAWEIYERMAAQVREEGTGDEVSVHMYEIRAGVMHGSETITEEV